MTLPTELISYYLKESLESLSILLLYKFISKSNTPMYLLAQTSLLIGLFTTIIEKYNKEYYKNLKSGIIASIGGILIKQM
jgi:hypothetical protein